mmetsp:Transcript_482/g.1445  ORF Transcript_482/g.1445 Transcript_482/m.1445 type:complete len:214 (-) Transcript_482:158-799(-)
MVFSPTPQAGLSLATILCSFIHAANAFVSPRPFAVPTGPLSLLEKWSDSSAHEMLPPPASFLGDGTSPSAFLVSDGMSAAAMDPSGSLSGLRTFFVVVGAAVVGFVLLATFTAMFVVPKAAEQLEADTKRLRPGLWEEFEARLEEGETMAIRPDLLQELGDTMKPVIIADYEAKANEKIPDPQKTLESTRAPVIKRDTSAEIKPLDADNKWMD